MDRKNFRATNHVTKQYSSKIAIDSTLATFKRLDEKENSIGRACYFSISL